jgi:signal transduction histidine kinase
MPFLQKFQQLSLRTRIITLFTLIVLLVVIVLSRLSYLTVRDIYLNQLSEQVGILTRSIISGLNLSYLDLISMENDQAGAYNYYRQELSDRAGHSGLEEVFLFRKDLEVMLHTGSVQVSPTPALILNRREILELETGRSFTSEPFRGQDGGWYLWGFYRINDNHFLGIREQASRLARVDQLSRIFWIIGIVSVLLTLTTGWFLAGVVSRPVEKLVSFSRELGKGNFESSAPAGIYGELRILRNALDKMRTDLAGRNSEKEQMLAQIAHELRNPLGGMELLAGLIKEDMEKNNSETHYVSKILDEIQQLKGLVNEYLKYSKPVQSHPRLVKPSEILNEIHLSLTNQLAKKNISMDYSDNQIPVWFDPGHLRQVLLNLIVNSIEAAPAKSKITITTEKSRDQAIIKISDEGKGIKKGEDNRIFEPFYSTKEDGTGLGLAICQKLCLENHAEIGYQNNSGKGCTFFIITGTKQS